MLSRLRQEPALAECSVYLLSCGNILLRVNGSMSPRPHVFLPAYYITNCLAAVLERFVSLESFMRVFAENLSFVEQRNLGDLIIALLFIVSGACCLLWMLTLLLYLLPPAKRKPALAQLATVFYAVVLTILLAQITRAALAQYYDDRLDMLNIRLRVYTPATYRAAIAVLQALTAVAFWQMGVYMAPRRRRVAVAAVGAALALAHTAVHATFEARYDLRLPQLMPHPYAVVLVVLVVLKLLFMSWVALLLAHHTAVARLARVGYGKRVLGLALLTWILLAVHAVVKVLTVTRFDDEWLIRFWIEYLPLVCEVFLLTTMWEWIYSIAVLEKRAEMAGVLGRRISLDDAGAASGKGLSTELSLTERATARALLARSSRASVDLGRAGTPWS
jgi:hypothetical protein